MASPNFRDNFEQKRGRLCRIFECRDHVCGALADDDGGAAADDVDAVFALPHVIVARVGGIAHEGALAPLPHRSIFRRISAEHGAVSPLHGLRPPAVQLNVGSDPIGVRFPTRDGRAPLRLHGEPPSWRLNCG